VRAVFLINSLRECDICFDLIVKNVRIEIYCNNIILLSRSYTKYKLHVTNFNNQNFPDCARMAWLKIVDSSQSGYFRTIFILVILLGARPGADKKQNNGKN
jgi:hypothetical protein